MKKFVNLSGYCTQWSNFLSISDILFYAWGGVRFLCFSLNLKGFRDYKNQQAQRSFPYSNLPIQAKSVERIIGVVVQSHITLLSSRNKNKYEKDSVQTDHGVMFWTPELPQKMHVDLSSPTHTLS